MYDLLEEMKQTYAAGISMFDQLKNIIALFVPFHLINCLKEQITYHSKSATGIFRC